MLRAGRRDGGSRYSVQQPQGQPLLFRWDYANDKESTQRQRRLPTIARRQSRMRIACSRRRHGVGLCKPGSGPIGRLALRASALAGRPTRFSRVLLFARLAYAHTKAPYSGAAAKNRKSRAPASEGFRLCPLPAQASILLAFWNIGFVIIDRRAASRYMVVLRNWQSGQVPLPSWP